MIPKAWILFASLLLLTLAMSIPWLYLAESYVSSKCLLGFLSLSLSCSPCVPMYSPNSYCSNQAPEIGPSEWTEEYAGHSFENWRVERSSCPMQLSLWWGTAYLLSGECSLSSSWKSFPFVFTFWEWKISLKPHLWRHQAYPFWLCPHDLISSQMPHVPIPPHWIFWIAAGCLSHCSSAVKRQQDHSIPHKYTDIHI